MKRIIAMLMLIAMCMVTVCASAQAASIQDAVEEYLDASGITYTYNSEAERYTYTRMIDSTLGKCEIRIYLETNGLRVYAYSPISAKAGDPGNIAAVAEFMTRVNYNLYLGNFELDYTDGEIRYKCSAVNFDDLPTQEELDWLVDIPGLMMERYGDALAKVVMMGVAPDEALAEIQ